MNLCLNEREFVGYTSIKFLFQHKPKLPHVLKAASLQNIE